ncbi:MAG: PEP-CTERM sorting domain-containing protein [Pirellulaceae bacterium]
MDVALVADLMSLLLFARLNIEHIVPGMTDPSLVVGDQFDIDVVVGGPFGTEFTNCGFGTPTLSAGTGTITVTDAAAVPEPGKAVMVGVGFAALYRRRKRTA